MEADPFPTMSVSQMTEKIAYHPTEMIVTIASELGAKTLSSV